MMYKSVLPSPALCEFVRNYTIIDLRSGDTAMPLVKQRSPKAEQKIVFYLKSLPSFYAPRTGDIQTPARVTIFSHQLDQRTINMTGDFFALIIFLQPGVLHRMIHLPMMELLLTPSDAEQFFGTEVRLVSEQLESARDLSSMIAVAEHFLLSKFDACRRSNAIDLIATHLLKDPTTFSLDEVARQACLSQKQFFRKFTERIGLSPKFFSRLSRFNHAYKFKLNHEDISWSAVAQEFGYTDYHHLEKEFKGFTALTPVDWLKTHLAAPERILHLR